MKGAMAPDTPLVTWESQYNSLHELISNSGGNAEQTYHYFSLHGFHCTDPFLTYGIGTRHACKFKARSQSAGFTIKSIVVGKSRRDGEYSMIIGIDTPAHPCVVESCFPGFQVDGVLARSQEVCRHVAYIISLGKFKGTYDSRMVCKHMLAKMLLNVYKPTIHNMELSTMREAACRGVPTSIHARNCIKRYRRGLSEKLSLSPFGVHEYVGKYREYMRNNGLDLW